MQLRWIGVPRSRSLERAAIDLSPKARQRLRWFAYSRAHEGPAALTGRYFGSRRQTCYRWKRRYDPDDLKSLQDGSPRPPRRRQPTWTLPLVESVLALRRPYPRWGKDKLGLPPRSPQLNGHVERAQRTHTEEFPEVTACSLQIPQLNQELRDWERIANPLRPHQALGYRTPHQFLTQRPAPSQLKECH